MKRKIFAAISVTLFLVATLFIVFPAESQFDGTIKIGAIGPMPWIQGKGIAEGCKLAAQEINDAGGVQAGGNSYEIEVVSADTLRGQSDPTTATGTAAAMELVAAGVDFIIGGFRTEAAYGIREVVADAALSGDKPIYFIAGAATNELIDDGTGSDPATVRSDYNRYRFIFRITPMNSTMLFYAIAGYMKYLMIAKLAPITAGIPGSCAEPVKIAVISEDLTWAEVMHTYLTSVAFWNHAYYMDMAQELRGVAWNASDPNTYGVTVVYQARVSPSATDVSSELLAAQSAGATLIIEVLSGPVGRTMAIQYASLGIKAILTGIDVPGQELPLHWEATGGGCEYESFLATAGTRTPVTPVATAFWDAYEDEYGHSPIYTSYGAYDGVRAIRELIEDENNWPMGAAELVPLVEKTIRLRADLTGGTAMMATIQYTGPHPMSMATYGTYMGGGVRYNVTNPTMQGTLHDLYHTAQELTPYAAYPYYARSMVAQWQEDPLTGEGKLQIFHPITEAFSQKFKITPDLYSHADTDISGIYGFPDGYVDTSDMSVATYCWLSSPGDAAWDYGGYYLGLVVDQDGNHVINIADVSLFGKAWNYNATVEYGQWPL